MSLTPTDLKRIKVIVKEAVDIAVDTRLDIRFAQFEKKLDQKFEERFSLLPTKDEFYQYMDVVLGHYKKTDEEQVVLGSQVRRNTDDIKVIKNHLSL